MITRFDLKARDFGKCENICYEMIQSILSFISRAEGESIFKKDNTIQGLMKQINDFSHFLTQELPKYEILSGRTNLFLKSTVDMFLEYMSSNFPSENEIEKLKQKLVCLGEEFALNLVQNSEKISKNAMKFFKKPCVDLL